MTWNLEDLIILRKTRAQMDLIKSNVNDEFLWNPSKTNFLMDGDITDSMKKIKDDCILDTITTISILEGLNEDLHITKT